MTSCELVPSENGTTKIADFRFVAGPGYNRTISNRGSPKHAFSSKTGAIYKTRPPTKALFGCVRDLVLAPPNGKPALGETPGHLGTRMHTRTCHGTSQIVAENVMRSTKNIKMAQKMKTALKNSIFSKIRQSDAESFSLRSELSNDMRYVYFGQCRTN